MKKIYFDMDGTLVDLYNVPNWLHQLRAHESEVFELAPARINLSCLAKHLTRLQQKGYIIGIISWLPAESTAEFDKEVRKAKIKWLAHHLPSINFDEEFFVPYGTPKELCGNGILFDDNEAVRESWGEGAFDETKIFSVLKLLG